MKKLILTTVMILGIIAAFGQKDECKSSFYKQKKKSKESVSFNNEEEFFKTKYCNIYSNGVRYMGISFIREDTVNKLMFLSGILNGGVVPKSKIVLGKNIRIAFVFEDGTIDIIKFEANENVTSFWGEPDEKSSFNYYELTDTFLTKLNTVKLVKVEMQNPFGTLNETKIRSEPVKNAQQKRIAKISSCFISRVTE